MGNVNPQSTVPLLSPGQLKTLKNTTPAQPIQPLDSVLGVKPISTLLTPDQLRQQVGKMPSAQPNFSIYGSQAAPQNDPSKQGLSNMASELQGLMKTADSQVLSLYAVAPQTDTLGNVVKDASGNISYTLNGRPITRTQLQQHLLPRAGLLHQQLNETKSIVDNQFQGFLSATKAKLPFMSSAEQTAVQIQLKAIQAIYSDFIQRISQVDNLIK